MICFPRWVTGDGHCHLVIGFRSFAAPDTLPYTVGTPAAFGFIELNRRSLTDNAPNVMFSLASNTRIAQDFPYVPLSHSRSRICRDGSSTSAQMF